jgi:zinc protease
MTSRRALLAAALCSFVALTPSAHPAQTQVRSSPPAPGALRKFAFPNAQQFALENGLKVVVVERHTLPIVEASIVIDAGAIHEPRDKGGLASLTGTLLSEGTRSLSGAQIAERMERLGAQYSTFSGYTQAGGSLTSLSNVFPQALALAATTIVEPSFPQSEFERVKSEALANDEQKKASVEGIGPDIFARAVFDPGAPYSRPEEGTKETITRLTRDDVANWHRAMYAPAATVVLLVGDITAAEARKAVQGAFGRWRASAPHPASVEYSVRTTAGRRVILVDRPGSVQSLILVGQPAIAAADPDFIPMIALNRVLGGGFNARINLNLREKHGFTYGAFSNLDARRGAGLFSVSSTVRTSATDSALVETLKEYGRILEEPIPAQEFRDAVNNVVASFPSSVQTVQGLERRLLNLMSWQLPLNFYATYRERLSALTPDQVQRAARRHLSPNALTIVVVGDLAKVEQPVRALNLGAVEVWDVNGNEVR